MNERDALPEGLGDGLELDGRRHRLRIVPEVGCVTPATNSHQRALAGAVFADNGQHFAVAERERNVVERLARRQTAC